MGVLGNARTPELPCNLLQLDLPVEGVLVGEEEEEEGGGLARDPPREQVTLTPGGTWREFEHGGM